MADLPFGLVLDRHFPFVRRAESMAASELTLQPGDPAPRPYVRTTGSLSRRMILIAAAWITLLLTGGGFALDRVLTGAITRNFDDGLEYLLTSLIVSAEIDPEGKMAFNRQLSDQRFLEPYSGLYWQVSGNA